MNPSPENAVLGQEPIPRARLDSVTARSAVDAKIALFRSLFRGREEVYPRRFESVSTGRSGYAPACANEWVRGLCEKPRIKCAECPNRRFLPVTDEVVRWHLSGQGEQGRDFVMGVYPMLLDETCWFLAADFDGKAWQQDADAFLSTCRRLQIPAALERSRSGEGGHIWIFFRSAIPATLARDLGSSILTATMECRPDIGFRSYDRFFPNQNTLPKGGFGNLIALPLQKRARERGNTVFLGERFEPVPDQWAFLASVARLSRAQVEALVHEAERKGSVTGVRSAGHEDDEAPWLAPPSRRKREPPISGPLPKHVELVLADQLYIAKEDLPPALRNRLLRLAAFQNPEFYRAQAMRLPTFGKPRIICCAEDHPRHIELPRGCLDEVEALLRELKITPVRRDERFVGTPFNRPFRGELRPEQEAAAQALFAHETGVLAAGTAFGKTVVAAWLIAKRSVNTLVLVHRRQLLDQWAARLCSFLDLPLESIGQLGGGRKRMTGVLDVALLQSLARKGVVDDRVASYGHVVVDECHHLSAWSFERIARRAKARFITGLSATVTRKDGHHPIIFMQCGPVRYRVGAKQQAAARPFTHRVFVRPTGFKTAASAGPDSSMAFHEVYAALSADVARNTLICDDILGAVREGRSPLVLTQRKEHLQYLETRLRPLIGNIIVLRGGMGRPEWRDAMARLEAVGKTEERVILATGGYIGEGFDDPRLDTLFLALPVSWRGTIAQYAGRLHRLHESKREVRVYDYADLDIPMLARMFDRRCRGYEAIGYTILAPASALPGWPASVPLPMETSWKKDYCASVQRLVRDGVDAPLAGLFLQASHAPSPDAEGAERARSAAEAFLFQRLETLAPTAGKFCLNVELPIPFNERGAMEIDLLCAQARLVLELDGLQHLADTEAYRRDRRKDRLLQENGYFVLRFLTEDVGKDLDSVLEIIQRTLTRRLSQSSSLDP